MDNKHRNTIEFKVFGRYALFTDPITRVGGEKCSYQLPTYEALKGIVKSIYWKPTIVWVIDEVRVMRKIRTQTKGTKPLNYVGGGNTLAIYTFLDDVEYQVRAHFEWNEHRPELETDRNVAKHMDIARRALDRGGRQDIFLGTRDCQGYVEPCIFGEDASEYDGTGKIPFGFMFHGFDYPDETGVGKLVARFWDAEMEDGLVRFPKPADCLGRREIRDMTPKVFTRPKNLRPVEEEAEEVLR